MDEVSVQERVAASPDRLWAMVSDVTRMGSISPETTGCRWISGATGPAVGARFRGSNRSHGRRWSTTCTVVEAEPGRSFAFAVAVGPVKVARWGYRFEPDGDGTLVTEWWRDERASWMVRLSPVATGVPDRGEHNRQTMTETLRRLRQQAEAPTA